MVSDGLNKFVIQVCNFNLNDSIQFRWLQTSQFRPGGIKDVWLMDKKYYSCGDVIKTWYFMGMNSMQRS